MDQQYTGAGSPEDFDALKTQFGLFIDNKGL